MVRGMHEVDWVRKSSKQIRSANRKTRIGLGIKKENWVRPWKNKLGKGIEEANQV